MSRRTMQTSAGMHRLSLAVLLVFGTLAGLALGEVALRIHYVLSYDGRLKDLAANSEAPSRS